MQDDGGNTGIAIKDGGGVHFAEGATLTIASGVVTATSTMHRIDTQAGAASDDLDTINGGTDGQILFIRTLNAARDVVVKNGTGNLRLTGAVDFTLNETNDMLALLFWGSVWREFGRMNV